MKHALIVGATQVGKSTLIRRLVRELDCTVSGYETKKEDGMADAVNGSPIYIYKAGQPHHPTPENLVGTCKEQQPVPVPAAFDRAARLLEDAENEGVLIVMDEIGTMERCSERFCAEIMARLDGDRPVLAAVKHKDTAFLNAVRSHPNGRCFTLTEDNREEVYASVLAFMRAQLKKP